ncbi:MAG: hypothetical protein H0W73_16955 [Bacteroidetes bacterium]|nr:hypothetical protein [Bacteroidota bacterium]
MKEEGKKRAPRIPLTSEEVAELIEIKKIREHNKLQRFKKTKTFKYLNCFNILCFFIFCELVISFYGPCHYQLRYSKNVVVHFDDKIDKNGHRVIEDMNMIDVEGRNYKLIVDEFIETPQKYSTFKVGKDYLLQREIKAFVNTSGNYYRIQSASPILFLSVFLIFFSIIFYTYNLNQNSNSLFSIAIINAAAVFAFLSITV